MDTLDSPIAIASLVDHIAERLERAIMSGDLKPGSRLSEQGLAKRFGVSRGPLREAIRRLEGRKLIDRKPNGRQPGFTKACRRVLMEVKRPIGAREVCVELERYAPTILARHKDPLASVTTVLNRLVDYGEARSLSNDRGRRVWEWVSEAEPLAEAMAARRTA